MDIASPDDPLSELLIKGKEGQKILVIPNTKNNPDIFFACLGLSEGLKNLQHHAYIVSPKLALNKLWRFRLGKLKISGIYEKLPTQYAIQFKNSELVVSGVSLQTLTDGFQITLDATGNSEALPKKTAITEIPAEFDTVIFIGNPALDKLIELGWSQERILKENILLITNSKVKIPDSYLNIKIYQGKSDSFSLKVWDMFHDLQIKISPEIATIILSGIISFSDDFKKNISSSFFNQFADILAQGAEYYLADSLALNDLSVNKIKFLSRLYNNVHKLKDGIYFISADTEKQVLPRLRTQELLKISRIFDCRLAYVFLEGMKGKQVYFKANDVAIGLKQILKQLNGKGNSYDGMVRTELDLESFNKILKNLLGETNTVPGMPESPLDQATVIPAPLQLEKLLRNRK